MVSTFSFLVPNSYSLNKLRGELKHFLKKSRFIIDPADLRKGTEIKVALKSKTEFLSLIGYCMNKDFVFLR